MENKTEQIETTVLPTQVSSTVSDEKTKFTVESMTTEIEEHGFDNITEGDIDNLNIYSPLNFDDIIINNESVAEHAVKTALKFFRSICINSKK